MNLSTVESLVRRIEGFLAQPGNDAQAAGLAQEYTDLCRVTQRRLEQCAAILATGELQQAMQLAEAPVPVLDLVAILAFRQAREWRAYCLAHGLPAAEPFSEKAVRQLNSAYASPRAAPHPFYREYRRAVQLNDDPAALAALRRIVAQDPADTNARRELPRLERKFVQGRLARLTESLRAGDVLSVLTIAEEIEKSGLASGLEGEAWQSAQTLRAREGMAQLATLRAEDRWEDARLVLDKIADIGRRHGLAWPREDEAALENTLAWVERRSKAAADDNTYHTQLTELNRLLDEAEEQRLTTRVPRLADLRRRHEALRRKHHEIERLGRPLPENRAQRFELARHSLERQIERRVRMRRRMAYCASALVLVMTLILTVRAQSHRRARALAGELEHLVASREVVAVEKFAASLKDREARRTRVPELKAALGLAEAFLHRERHQEQALRQGVEDLEVLARDAFSTRSPEAVHELWERVQALHANLPRDLQAATAPRMVALQNHWESYLDKARGERHDHVDGDLRAAEAIAQRELRFEGGPEAARAAVHQLTPLLARLTEAVQTPIETLRVSSAMTGRLDAVKTRTAAFAREISEWDRYSPMLTSPVSLEEHVQVLHWLKDSEFAASGQARAATDALAAELTSTNLAVGLLIPEWAAATTADLERARPPFVPAEVLPAERAKYTQLRDDEYLHEVHLCVLRERRAATDQFSAARRVWSLRSLTTNRFGTREGRVYDPGLSPYSLSFEPREFRSYRWNIEEAGLSPETSTWQRAGLDGLIDSNTGSYRVPGLGCLDRINSETNVSPVFRAYLALQLHELMALRPWEWGLVWSPAAVADKRKLIESGAREIRRGDWLVPAVLREREQALRAHFERARHVSYLQQAQFFHALVTRAWEHGFSFAGHADLDGRPVLIDPEGTVGELWGWRRDTRAPGLLCARSRAGNPWQMLQAPLPWSALFTFRGDRKALLEAAAAEASVAPGSPGVNLYLPPLFREGE
jgi:hypothetical protein